LQSTLTAPTAASWSVIDLREQVHSCKWRQT
jgi:hypothetical protein